jgi:Polyketide cyclase / dehydrase and lipid transport
LAGEWRISSRPVAAFPIERWRLSTRAGLGGPKPLRIVAGPPAADEVGGAEAAAGSAAASSCVRSLTARVYVGTRVVTILGVTARVSATTIVPGRAAEAEALWYDPDRWAAWVDGFGHVVKLEGWPRVGGRLAWDSPPRGRGRVVERVTAYEPRAGQVLEVEDERLTGVQSVAFEPAAEHVRVTLTLEYELKRRNPLTPLYDPLFVRRALRGSLRRTLARFGHERRAEIELGLSPR